MRLAEHYDLELRSNLTEVGPDHTQCERLADPPAVAAVGRAADQFAVVEYRLRAARVRVRRAEHFERDKAVLEPLLPPRQQRVAADEVAFAWMHEAVEPRFQRRIFDRQLAA